MKTVIHNDDFALSYGFTEGIKDAFLKGITTSTSIRTNGPAYPLATKYLKSKISKIGLGLHLNLTDGPALNKNLANENGIFRHTFFEYIFLLLLPNNKLLNQITEEFELQYQTIKKSKIKIDHINSEKHIHMIPAIFEITCKFCKKNNIKYIRLVHEPYFLTGNFAKDIRPFYNANIIKFIMLNLFSLKCKKILAKYNVRTTDAFYGILHTNWMDGEIIKSCTSNALKNNFNSIEVLGHPAYINDKRDKKYTSEYIKWYSKLPNRNIERKSFTNNKLKMFFTKLNVSRVTFSEID